jgi:hypothetical protein
MNESRIRSARGSPEDAPWMATAYPLDVLRAVWLILVPEQRAAFLGEAHHQPEGAPK